MGKGQKSKAGRVLQMILLGANPNLLNPQGKRVVCSNAEDYDFVEAIEFDKLSRKGAKALMANVPLEEMWQGKISGPPHYNLIDDQILRYWIAKPIETAITVGGVNCIDAEYVRPQLDRADRDHFAIEEGKPGDPADVGGYGLFTSFKWTSKRGNKGTSRFEAGFVTQAVVQRPLSGGVAQNAKFRLNGINVAGDVTLQIQKKGEAGEQVTYVLGETAAQFKTKLEALNSIDAATVTGRIAPPSGPVHKFVVTGGTSGNYTSNGGAAFTLPITKAALQTNQRALGGQYLGVVVDGTSAGQTNVDLPATKGGAGSHSVNGEAGWNDPTDGQVFEQASDHVLNLRGMGTNTAPNPTVLTDGAHWLQWDFGAANAQVIDRLTIDCDNNGGNVGPARFRLVGSANGTFSDAVTLYQSASNEAYTAVDNEYLFNNSTPYRAYRLVILQLFYIGSDWGMFLSNVGLWKRTAAAADFTFSFPDATTPAAPTATGTGATATVFLAAGQAGGAVDFEITTPTNINFTVNKTAGNANYLVSQQQEGSDGVILSAMLPEDPILPGHLFLYSSTTAAGLDDPNSMIGQIGEWEFDDPKVCMPVSHHIPIVDPLRPNLPATYNSHAEEDAQEDGPKLSVTMDCDENGVVDGLVGIIRASGARTVSAPRYWRIAAIRPGSPRRLWLDFYGSIGATAERKHAGAIEQRTFVFDLLENKEVGWNFKVKTRRPA